MKVCLPSAAFSCRLQVRRDGSVEPSTCQSPSYSCFVQVSESEAQLVEAAEEVIPSRSLDTWKTKEDDQPNAYPAHQHTNPSTCKGSMDYPRLQGSGHP
eukprot:5753505-Amphidinium_carterae.2